MSNSGTSWNLIGDIGGTNMRLAKVEQATITDQKRYPTTGDMHIEEAISDFVARSGSSPAHAGVAAAGVIADGAVKLTNAGKIFSEQQILKASGSQTARIINDFEAAAWSLVTAHPNDLIALQGDLPSIPESNPAPTGTRLIVGPGTGLGVGSQIWAGNRPHVLQGEGGHIRIAPENHDDIELFKRLADLWPEVQMGSGLALEAEAIVSGTGIPVVMRALEELHGKPISGMKAAEIFANAKEDSSSLAAIVIDRFCHYLGAVSGDLALALTAEGGIFLSGGVLQANDWIFEKPTFMKAFNEGGRHTKFRKEFPVYLYRNKNFGLLGTINALEFCR